MSVDIREDRKGRDLCFSSEKELKVIFKKDNNLSLLLQLQRVRLITFVLGQVLYQYQKLLRG